MNKNSTLFFTLLLFTELLYSQPVSQTFDGGGIYTYIIPPGYTANVTIQAWGAGGGGGSNTSGAKGGGCGGAYASSTVALGAGNYIVIVGTGGAPGIAGSNSSFSSLVVADGGGSTAGTSGGVAGSSTGSTGNTTILAGTGFSASGNNGGAGGTAANGGGAGGAGGIANNGAGMAGIVPGGGGGGKAGPGGGSSGSGADGRVVVTINSVLLPLPVKFSTIKAFEKQQAVQIEWSASAEQNIYKYQVERSVDGIAFISIGNVAANNTAGESYYKFLDPTPLAGVNFYRIKSVDMDNRFVFSSIVKINLNENIHGFTLYPNPISNGTVSFQSSDLGKGNYSVKLFSPIGLQVYSQSFVHTGGAINLTIQLPGNLQPGLYSIQLATSEKKLMSKKIIIE